MVENLREQARERQRLAAEETNAKLGRSTPDSTLLPNLAKAKASQIHIELAEKAGIGKSSMSYLMAVQRDEHELFSRVKTGGH